MLPPSSEIRECTSSSGAAAGPIAMVVKKSRPGVSELGARKIAGLMGDATHITSTVYEQPSSSTITSE